MKDKYKTLICCCWGVLIFYSIIKLISGKSFEIVCENERFIYICNLIDNSWLRYIVSGIIYSISSFLIYLSMTLRKFKKDFWLLFILFPISFIKDKLYWLGLILDFITLILLPLIVCKFNNWKRVLLGVVLVISFQVISLFIRNLGIYYNNDSLTISIILSIDYYIMIVLYYLYSFMKKGDTN